MSNDVAGLIGAVPPQGDPPETALEPVSHHCVVLLFRQSQSRPVSRWIANGRSTTCAHCSQPFPRCEDRTEAQVGGDTRLYCHGTTCEQDALEAAVSEKLSGRRRARGRAE